MKILVSVLALSVSLVSIALGQQNIKGIVKDDTGVPVPGATVVIKGTSNYTVTDVNGEFVLASAKDYPFSILFNLVGYQTEEVDIYEPIDEPVEVNLKTD